MFELLQLACQDCFCACKCVCNLACVIAACHCVVGTSAALAAGNSRNCTYQLACVCTGCNCILACNGNEVELAACIHSKNCNSVSMVCLDLVCQSSDSIHLHAAGVSRNQLDATNSLGACQEAIQLGACNLGVQRFDLLLCRCQLHSAEPLSLRCLQGSVP